MINIFYSGNKKVFDMILTSIVSILNHTNEALNIYILTMDLQEINPKYIPINENQISYLNTLVKEKNTKSQVSSIDMKEVYTANPFTDINNLNLFTPYALLRLFADKVDLPEKIIYLDVDTIVNNDIKELFDIDITDYEMGVVRDVFIWGMKNKRKYFNSGVLLMNLKKIKETKYLEKARNLCNSKKMLFLDQDALNYSWTNILHLDRKFNSIHVKRKRYDKTVIHHLCDCRAYLVIRYKSNNTEMVKKHMPYYIPLMEQCEEYKKETQDL